MIKQYDHVKLKSGKHAVIVEIWKQGVSYEADIEIDSGNFVTETIRHEDILSVFVEVETLLRQVL